MLVAPRGLMEVIMAHFKMPIFFYRDAQLKYCMPLGALEDLFSAASIDYDVENVDRAHT